MHRIGLHSVLLLLLVILIPSPHDLLGISCIIRVFFETATQTNSEFSKLGTGGCLISECHPLPVLGVVVGP